MIGKLGKIVMQMIAGANVSTLLLMLLAGYSDRLNPASFPLMSTAGLFFPILLAVNMAFLVFWVIFKFRWHGFRWWDWLSAMCPCATMYP